MDKIRKRRIYHQKLRDAYKVRNFKRGHLFDTTGYHPRSVALSRKLRLMNQNGYDAVNRELDDLYSDITVKIVGITETMVIESANIKIKGFYPTAGIDPKDHKFGFKDEFKAEFKIDENNDSVTYGYIREWARLINENKKENETNTRANLPS